MTGMQKKVKTDIREILKPIDPLLKRVDDEIREKLNTGITLLDESALHLFKRGGKKIRAALIILCSGLKGRVPEDIIEIAAAAEIVHGATLVHDDIIDQSLMRRGEPTVARKWGNKVAVLAGDFMYTRALEVAVGEQRQDLFPVMVAATKDMVKGELYQIQYSGINVISKEHYFRIIELKTARFMAACAKLGAVKAGLSDEDSDRLYEMGLNLGYAFQIVDDTLDLADEQESTGKDAGNDFLDGKITLPFLHLLESSTEEERKTLRDFFRSPDREKWETVKRKMQDSGSAAYCIETARGYVRKAVSCLDLFPPSLYKDMLLDLANFFVERNY